MEIGEEVKRRVPRDGFVDHMLLEEALGEISEKHRPASRHASSKTAAEARQCVARR